MLCKHKIQKNTIVVCPELSIQNYICIRKNKILFSKAIKINSPYINKLKILTKKHNIFLCVTIFEKSKDQYFNKLIIINPEGKIILKYNKKNIPSEKCYQEKFYFAHSSNKFKFFEVYGQKIGVMICWDQWHYKSYDYMKKNNVNLIICPTAIGHCRENNKRISISNEKDRWIEVIKSNSLMINTPVIICNRIGVESSRNSSISFWGNSFITNCSGDIVKKMSNNESAIYHEITLKDQITAKRLWNFED